MTANTPAADAPTLAVRLREAASRVSNHCFGKGDATLMSIPAQPGYDVDLLLMAAADALEASPAISPSASPAPGDTVAIAGDMMTWTLAQFRCRAQMLAHEEQQKIAPDNALIAFICEAVRLSRENERMATQPIGAPPLTPEQCEALEAGARALIKLASWGGTEYEEPVKMSAQALVLRQLARGRG